MPIDAVNSTPMIRVIVAWVNPAGQPAVKQCPVAVGTSAATLARECLSVAEGEVLPAMGIFSQKIVQPEQYILQEGERLEFYQPLILTPMEVRRARARVHPVGRRKPRP